MGKKINIPSDEIQRILSLHENYKAQLIGEQSLELNKKKISDAKQFFDNAKSKNCLTDPTLDFTQIKTKNNENRAFIEGPSKSIQGKVKRIYNDFTYEIVDPKTEEVLKTAKWSCDIENTPNTTSGQKNDTKPETKTLNANQLKVLELIKPQGWFYSPAPTDVEVDEGIFEKLDLNDDTNALGLKYSKYFKNDFPNGFFVYKKAVKTPTNQPSSAQKVEITAEACKVAIESLWNNLTSPNSYPLTRDEVNSYRQTAQICAEPVNKSKFLLRFGLNSKLKDLSKSKFAIKTY